MTPIELLAIGGFAIVVLLLLYRPTVGLIALALFYPFNVLVPRFPVAGLNSETILFGVALGLTLMRFGARIPPLRYSGPLLSFLGVLLMALLIGSVGNREYSGQVLGVWEMFKAVKSLSFPMLLFALVYFWFDERERRRQLLVAANVAVLLPALLALVEFGKSVDVAVYGMRIKSLFENPNGLGVFLAGFGLLPLYLMRDARPVGKTFYLMAYLIGQVALVITLSRSAWLGTIVAHAVWFAFTNRQMLAVGALAVVLFLTLLFPFLPNFIADRITNTMAPRDTVFQVAGGVGGSGAERVVFYQIGADMFVDSPLWGHGLDGFFLKGPQYGARYGMLDHITPHSLIVKLATEMGLLGLGVFGWIAWMVLRCAADVWRRSEEAPRLGLLLAASALALFASELFGNNFFSVHQISGFFWMLLACAVRELEQSEEEAESATEGEVLPAFSRVGAWASADRTSPRPASP